MLPKLPRNDNTKHHELDGATLLLGNIFIALHTPTYL